MGYVHDLTSCVGLLYKDDNSTVYVCQQFGSHMAGWQFLYICMVSDSSVLLYALHLCFYPLNFKKITTPKRDVHTYGNFMCSSTQFKCQRRWFNMFNLPKGIKKTIKSYSQHKMFEITQQPILVKRLYMFNTHILQYVILQKQYYIR
jgi:hypothetical protein